MKLDTDIYGGGSIETFGINIITTDSLMDLPGWVTTDARQKDVSHEDHAAVGVGAYSPFWVCPHHRDGRSAGQAVQVQ